MRIFLKMVAANLVATLLTVILLGLMAVMGCVVVIGLISSAAGRHKAETVQPKTVLVLDLDTNIMDSPQQSGVADILNVANSGQLSLYEMLQAIKQAGDDKNIVAMFMYGSLQPADDGSGYATLREVRQAILDFKAKGKKVFSYVIEPSLKDYYLATAASDVTLNPFGMLDLNGPAEESLYLGNALKQYGVDVQVTKVGKYKSATEIFTGDHMSDADKEQLTKLLGSIWSEVSTTLAASRKIALPDFQQLADNTGVYMPADALKNKLVDHLGYFDEVVNQLNALAEHDDDLESFRQITLAKYAEKINPPGDKLAQKIMKEGDRIALVYAEGEIVDGEGGAGQVGGDSLARELRDLRTDKDVKAIVLRVNSPGGSAVASEVIQREIRLLKEAKKPVIVSFGSLAASGGYWISTYGDYIFAEPTTITGSIGVFGMKFNVKQIASDHGLTFDSVKTTKFGDMDSISQPWTKDEQDLAQTVVDYLYDQFLAKVAEGRKLTVTQVGDIAQGRVWSGTDAIDIHLVDAIGGLQDALNMAEDKAGLKGKKWTLQQVPEKVSPAEALIQALGGNESQPVARAAQNSVTQTLLTGHDPVSTALQKVDADWRLIRGFNDPNGVYARMPYLTNF